MKITASALNMQNPKLFDLELRDRNAAFGEEMIERFCANRVRASCATNGLISNTG